MRKPIVILGGMGPQASLRFHQLLINKSAAHHSGENDKYPPIVHFSLPVADFISDDTARGAAIKILEQYTPIIRRLESSQITLACNTAHVLAKQVKLLQAPPFVPLIETVARHVHAQGFTRVGLLATPTTIRTKLYEQALGRQGMSTLAPSAAQQTVLEAAIRAVIAGAPREQHARKVLTIARELHAQGAQAIILGCTELPLVFPHAKAAIPVYDCLDIYAEAVIARHYLYNGA